MKKWKQFGLIGVIVLAVALAGAWFQREYLIIWVLDKLTFAPPGWVYPGARILRQAHRYGNGWDDGSKHYLRLECPADVATVMKWYREEVGGGKHPEDSGLRSLDGPRDVMLPGEADLVGNFTFASEIHRHPGEAHSELAASRRGMGVTIWGHGAGKKCVIEVMLNYHGL